MSSRKSCRQRITRLLPPGRSRQCKVERERGSDASRGRQRSFLPPFWNVMLKITCIGRRDIASLNGCAGYCGSLLATLLYAGFCPCPIDPNACRQNSSTPIPCHAPVNALDSTKLNCTASRAIVISVWLRAIRHVHPFVHRRRLRDQKCITVEIQAADGSEDAGL